MATLFLFKSLADAKAEDPATCLLIPKALRIKWRNKLNGDIYKQLILMLQYACFGDSMESDAAIKK